MTAIPAQPVQPRSAVAGLPFVSMATITREYIDWLWEGRLARGKLALLSADSGVGKSTIAVDLAARISSGNPMPFEASTERSPENVLLVMGEDGIGDTVLPRLQAAGGTVDRVHALPTTEVLVIPDDMRVLEAGINGTDASLVVIDPLSLYAASRYNLNNGQDVRIVLGPIARLAERTNTAILVIRHNKKSEAATAVYKGEGSVQIGAAVRTEMTIGKAPSQPTHRVFAMAKANIAANATSLVFEIVSDEQFGVGRVRWLSTSQLTADDLLAVNAPMNRVRPHQEAAQALKEILGDSALPAKEALAELAKAGFQYEQSGSEVQRLKKAAGIKPIRVGFGDGSYWLWQVQGPNRP